MPEDFSGIAKRFTRSILVTLPEARSRIAMPSRGAGFLSFFALSLSAFAGEVENTIVLLSAEDWRVTPRAAVGGPSSGVAFGTGAGRVPGGSRCCLLVTGDAVGCS